MKAYLIGIMVAVLLSSGLVLAQNTSEEASTRLEADQKAGIVRIIIEGKEVAQFTPKGLRVIGDITYGGVLRDAGPDEIENDIRSSVVSEGSNNDAP